VAASQRACNLTRLRTEADWLFKRTVKRGTRWLMRSNARLLEVVQG
jgi:hypothetical protein